MPMFRLVGKGEFRISADVSEAYAAHIKQGNEAEVFFPDISKNIQTSVKVVGDEINPLNRTFNIELALPKSSTFIKANMIAYVKIKDYEAKDRLQVPVSVVQKLVDGNFVFIEVNGKASKRTVKTGRDFNGQIEILDGLQTGDKLIVTGYLDLIEGQPLVSSK
jgi:multidrug efflux pump subunit AcrA (membrane-fusion protein)